jgi:nucleoside-diphosphate-sugar epimerase
MADVRGSAIVEWPTGVDTDAVPPEESTVTSDRSPADARPTLLILGANGRLGTAAACAFAAAGWRVLAQVRRVANADLAAIATPLAVPLDDTATLAAAASGASVVLHAVSPVYTRWEAEAMPALHAGLAVAERLGAHFMFPGNVYNFGASMPALLTEDTPQRPSTRKGEIRVDMERTIAARVAGGRFTASVLRAGDFFGSGSGSWFDLAIAKSLRAGRLAYPGPLDLPHAWAYLPDLARAFVRVAEQPAHPAFASRHFEGHTLTGRQLLDGIEAAAIALGIAPARGLRRSGIPWRLIRLAGLVVPSWFELAQMAYLWTVPHALVGRRLAALPGPPLVATPLAAALRDALVALEPASFVRTAPAL